MHLTKLLGVNKNKKGLYVAFSQNRKRSKGRKNKSEGRMRPAGRTLAMSGLDKPLKFKNCRNLDQILIYRTVPCKNFATMTTEKQILDIIDGRIKR